VKTTEEKIKRAIKMGREREEERMFKQLMSWLKRRLFVHVM
jgi:hypothetical protein